MTEKIETILAGYTDGTLDRRTFMARLIALTGSMAMAHWLLESSGLARTMVSDIESRAKQVTSQTVQYPSSPGVKVSGYLSLPKRKGKFPGVIVIHENRGLNEHTRDVARRFAAEGFAALAPDLLSRKGGTGAVASPDKARELLMSLAPADMLTDLEAGLAYLDSHAQVKKGHLGSVGFCWGGARSFALAAESKRLRAAVVFYGTAPDKLEEVRCPVLGLYGEKDERITSKVPEVEAALKKAGKHYEYKIYTGADHAFFNDTGERYNPAAAKDAWTRTLAFLRKNLA